VNRWLSAEPTGSQWVVLGLIAALWFLLTVIVLAAWAALAWTVTRHYRTQANSN
jgi:hypothetical protein